MLTRLLDIKPLNLNLGLLLLRLASGLLMMQYGWEKFSRYNEYVADFPDPLGVSNAVSLGLTIFAELVCPTFIVLGLWTRLAIIPLVVQLVIVIVIVHHGDPLTEREHALSFLVPYLTLFLAGPGRYTIDHYLKGIAKKSDDTSLKS